MTDALQDALRARFTDAIPARLLPFLDAMPDDDAWRALHASLEGSMNRTGDGSEAHRSLFLRRLVEAPETFPEAFDALLRKALRETPDAVWDAAGERIVASLARVPAPRAEALRARWLEHAVVYDLHQGALPRRAKPAQEDAAAMIEAALRALIAAPEQHPRGIARIGPSQVRATALAFAWCGAWGRPALEGLREALERELSAPQNTYHHAPERRCRDFCFGLLARDAQLRVFEARQDDRWWMLPWLEDAPGLVARTLRTLAPTAADRLLRCLIEHEARMDWTEHVLDLIGQHPSFEVRKNLTRWLARVVQTGTAAQVLRVLEHANIETQHLLLPALLDRCATPLTANPAPLDAEALFSRAPEAAQVALARALTARCIEAGDAGPLERARQHARTPRAREAVELGLERLRLDVGAVFDEADAWLERGAVAGSPLRAEELRWMRDALNSASTRRVQRELTAYAAPHLAYIAGHEPLVIVGWLRRILHLNSSAQPQLLTETHRALGARMDTAALWWIRNRPFKEGEALSLFYAQHHQGALLTPDDRLRMLADGNKTLRRAVTQSLVAHPDGATPGLIAMLSERARVKRTAAADALALIAPRAAVDPLLSAIARETHAATRDTLQAALNACEAARRPDDPRAWDQGVYALAPDRLAQALDPNALLETLRDVIYAPPTALSWHHLCDLLARARAANLLDTALSYVLHGEGPSRWPDHLRTAPHSWDGLPMLADLGLEGVDCAWVTVFDFAQPATRDAFLDARLAPLEARARKRKLPRDHVAAFLDWIDRAWAWCAAERVPLSDLEVQLDGGAYKGVSRPDTTTLKLIHGFGVSLTREGCFTGQRAPAGMRWVRVQLDKDHLLRKLHNLSSAKRHLDLRAVLTDAQAG